MSAKGIGDVPVVPQLSPEVRKIMSQLIIPGRRGKSRTSRQPSNQPPSTKLEGLPPFFIHFADEKWLRICDGLMDEIADWAVLGQKPLAGIRFDAGKKARKG